MTSSPRAIFGVAAALASIIVSVAACGGDDPPPAEPAPEAGDEAAPPPPRPDGGGEEIPPGLPQVECAVGAAIELESNDTPETANEITELAFCGVLATPKDVDYFTFETPQGTKLTVFQGVIDGKIDFELTLNGETFGPGQTAKFGSGRYLVKAFTKSDEPGSYRVRLQFDP